MINNGELYFKYLLEGKNNTKIAMVFSMSLAILFSLTPKLAYNHVFRLTFKKNMPKLIGIVHRIVYLYYV